MHLKKCDTAKDGMDSWKVYLLECADSTYYCGVAKHVDRRLPSTMGYRLGERSIPGRGVL